MCLQRKKVQGVLTGAVRSVTKRLALHCIATAILHVQRVFPHTANKKQDKKLHSGLRQGQATRLSVRRSAQVSIITILYVFNVAVGRTAVTVLINH